MPDVAPTVRPYRSEDEDAWLRCRALSFLGSSYFDDVLTAKPRYDSQSVELVALAASEGRPAVAGVLDVTVNGSDATIETIATHPDHVRRGVATSLLQEASTPASSAKSSSAAGSRAFTSVAATSCRYVRKAPRSYSDG